MTDHRSNNTNAAIEAMRSSMDSQDKPLIGCFWYSINNKTLFGTDFQIHDSVPYYHSSQFDKNVRTGTMLHQHIWNKGKSRVPNLYFHGDYTKVPRGRVFEFEGEGFKVYTGSWIEECDCAREDILREFQLPRDRTEFVIDRHWDIGHGWSEEF